MAEADDLPTDGQRVDKWLTYARFAKTRTVAQGLVAGGKVRINRDKVTDSARKVRLDDILTIRVPRGVQVVRVTGFAAARVSASLTGTLYQSLSEE